MPSENVVIINKDNFDALVQNQDKPVFIDFWAEWCGPCKAIAPIISELADEYADKIIIGKCDVDENMILAQSFNVMSIPTLVILKDGNEVERIVGARGKADLKLILDKYL